MCDRLSKCVSKMFKICKKIKIINYNKTYFLDLILLKFKNKNKN